jgi:hypothetical protein
LIWNNAAKPLGALVLFTRIITALRVKNNSKIMKIIAIMLFSILPFTGFKQKLSNKINSSYYYSFPILILF